MELGINSNSWVLSAHVFLKYFPGEVYEQAPLGNSTLTAHYEPLFFLKTPES